MIRAGVIGDPVRHSRSPAIHLAAAASVNVDLEYRAIPVSPDELEEIIEHVRSTGMAGLSVTMPHKEAVITHLDELTATALELGAVNHITNRDGHLVGNNTDGEGFLLGLENQHGIDVSGLHVCVIGAGGAARAIIQACGAAGAAEIAVVARREEAAVRAAAVGRGVGVPGDATSPETADVVVNATPLGMAGTPHADEMPLDVERLRVDAVVIDIVYNPVETPLLAAARARGLPTVDGLAMLAGQAAAQFVAWTGVNPPIEVMMDAARHAG